MYPRDMKTNATYEHIITYVTLIRFFIVMGCFMPVKVGFYWKCFLAYVTFKRSFVGMNVPMLNEGVVSTQSFGALVVF
jgi:hypothetical protein